MNVNRWTTRLLIGVVALLTVTGCEQPLPQSAPSGGLQAGETAEPVMIETDAASYPLGARISIRLVNRTGGTVRCNVCTSRMETLGDENVWRSVRESLGEDCKSGWVTLAPGQAVSETFTGGPFLPAGPYRIRATLLDLGSVPRLEVRSNTFTLISRDSSG